MASTKEFEIWQKTTFHSNRICKIHGGSSGHQTLQMFWPHGNCKVESQNHSLLKTPNWTCQEERLEKELNLYFAALLCNKREKQNPNSVWPKTIYRCRKAWKQFDFRIPRRSPLTVPLRTLVMLRNCNKTVNYTPTMQAVAASEACQTQEKPIQQQNMVQEPNLVGPEALLRK